MYQKYAVFQGRARRAEYFSFMLFSSIFGFISSLIGNYLFYGYYITDQINPISLIFTVFIFLPSLSVCVRRYHDLEKSGWSILIPIYGFIILFYEGTYGVNCFGEDPKGRGKIIKKCKFCNKIYKNIEVKCPNCGSSLYEETIIKQMNEIWNKKYIAIEDLDIKKIPDFEEETICLIESGKIILSLDQAYEEINTKLIWYKIKSNNIEGWCISNKLIKYYDE